MNSKVRLNYLTLSIRFHVLYPFIKVVKNVYICYKNSVANFCSAAVDVITYLLTLNTYVEHRLILTYISREKSIYFLSNEGVVIVVLNVCVIEIIIVKTVAFIF